MLQIQRDVPHLTHAQGQKVSRVLLIFLMTISQTVIAKDLILRLLECKCTFNGPGYLCFRGNTLGNQIFLEACSSHFKQRGRRYR